MWHITSNIISVSNSFVSPRTTVTDITSVMTLVTRFVWRVLQETIVQHVTLTRSLTPSVLEVRSVRMMVTVLLELAAALMGLRESSVNLRYSSVRVSHVRTAEYVETKWDLTSASVLTVS